MTPQQNVDLTPFNTLALPGQAVRYQKITAQAQLTAADLPAGKRFILGGGSNLVLNGDFDGLILHMAIPGKRLLTEDNEAWYIEAGAGKPLADPRYRRRGADPEYRCLRAGSRRAFSFPDRLGL